ncbi:MULTISPECIES: alternative ribosome rescue aminoacyl-tRNA hydrolase ArfB [unclassified Pedobacter]|uniref:alternative ribosome rescue aminoacyl-tRNA hydrolase ArfB n=1 Tax=unclassified Pedobacter TaxID=2628915 RepID=UPI000B4BE3F6|nr:MULTISPECIES: alternative ribosome rescue aminoacyl-tRNA hydrolase ArfB [unclassified Pedobacter]MCX2429135.1 alternative ribosome rescue aminoacyl-tRNA hydrolase ArfB [Pedobacter sp. GR22-10]MCX2583574.1 alternative ribosome rescue aminoacyl-tRNA hydrolase ArfB [Pedobacter sp. MR22-3]OWK71202.1 aminoacyl-tRNA hydrolase [Pedobacter sp. AJM]
MLPTRAEILKSVTFKTSRSGGKGGQNVNKVSSKVELIFDLSANEYLSDEEKTLLKSRLENRIDSEGLLHIIAQEDRSQLLNKEKTIAKLIELLKKSLHVQKKRKPTKIPKGVVENRLKNKAVHSDRKKNRKPPRLLKGE